MRDMWHIAVFIGILIFPLMASAQSIHVEWGYTKPAEPVVIGYRLYKEGIFVCETHDPDATAMDCDVNIVKRPETFTLTASFNDGTESPHSAPYPFYGNGPLKMKFRLRIRT